MTKGQHCSQKRDDFTCPTVFKHSWLFSCKVSLLSEHRKAASIKLESAHKFRLFFKELD